MKRINGILIIPALLTLTLNLRGQEESEEPLLGPYPGWKKGNSRVDQLRQPDNPFYFELCWTKHFPELSFSNYPVPDKVEAPFGKLTLYADYTESSEGTLLLYVINRTFKEVELSSQDGSIYTKLEYKTDQGDWERAQPHLYSWCGNSYDNPIKLSPGEYRKFVGYIPKSGELKEIRYKRYADDVPLVSNIGTGYIRAKDVDAARNDAMAIKSGNLESVSSIALGNHEFNPPYVGFFPARESAIAQLGSGKFPEDEVIPILEKIVATESDQALIISAQSSIESIHRKKRESSEAEEPFTPVLYYAFLTRSGFLIFFFIWKDAVATNKTKPQ